MSGSVFGDDVQTFQESLHQSSTPVGASFEPTQTEKRIEHGGGWLAEAHGRFAAARTEVRRMFFKRRPIHSGTALPLTEELYTHRPGWWAKAYSLAFYFMGGVWGLCALMVFGAAMLSSAHYWWVLPLYAVPAVGCLTVAYQASRYRWLASWMVLRSIRREKAAAYHLRRIHGTAGDLSSARGKFSQANIDAGESGEKATAEMLAPLAEIPGVRIYDGVSWPGTDAADLDHVVTGGNRIAVIDSKTWSGIHHQMDMEAQVTSTMEVGGKEIERTIRIHRGAQALMNQVGESFQVRAYLAVHAADSAVQPSFRSAASTPVAMASAQESVEEVRRFILGARGLGRVLVDDIDRMSALVPSPLEVRQTDIEADAAYEIPQAGVSRPSGRQQSQATSATAYNPRNKRRRR